MALELFGHPFSSYTWKALIAFYETDTAFEFRMVGPEHPGNFAALKAAWAMAKFPVLLDGGEPIIEASIIVEHIAPALIPDDRGAARTVRMLDRIFDNHVMANVQAIVSEHLPQLTDEADPRRIDRARAALDLIYAWLNTRLAGQTWAGGDAFTLADCAAAPSLFYAHWVHPIPEGLTELKAYRARLLARPSVARCVDEARPYRHLFPLAVPDQD